MSAPAISGSDRVLSTLLHGTQAERGPLVMHRPHVIARMMRRSLSAARQGPASWSDCAWSTRGETVSVHNAVLGRRSASQGHATAAAEGIASPATSATCCKVSPSSRSLEPGSKPSRSPQGASGWVLQTDERPQVRVVPAGRRLRARPRPIIPMPRTRCRMSSAKFIGTKLAVEFCPMSRPYRKSTR